MKLRKYFFMAALAAFLTSLGSSLALAHPHALVEASLVVVFDDKGLAGFQQHWVIDEMTSFTVLDIIQENGDGRLSKKEIAEIERVSMGSLKDFNYFTSILNQGQPVVPDTVTNFTASLDNGKLVYDFFLPCPVIASADEKEVKAAIYDESFFTYVAYANEDGSGIDPTSDPQFSNMEAQANPDDFQRFSDSVGLSGFQGKIKLAGPVQAFAVDARVQDAPDMAYFYGEIIPQAFCVRFRTQ